MFSTMSWGQILGERGEPGLSWTMSNATSVIASSDGGDIVWDRRQTIF